MPVTIAELEAVAARGCRAPEEAPLGQWLLRAAEGFTGRANSALAVGDPGMPLDAALRRVRDWYAARGLPAMVAVPHPLGSQDDSLLDRFLDRRGWRARPGPAVVMTAPAAEVARSGPGSDAELHPEPGPAGLGRYHYRGQPPADIAQPRPTPRQRHRTSRRLTSRSPGQHRASGIAPAGLRHRTSGTAPAGG